MTRYCDGFVGRILKTSCATPVRFICPYSLLELISLFRRFGVSLTFSCKISVVDVGSVSVERFRESRRSYAEFSIIPRIRRNLKTPIQRQLHGSPRCCKEKVSFTAALQDLRPSVVLPMRSVEPPMSKPCKYHQPPT